MVKADAMQTSVALPGPAQCWTCRHHASEFGECRISRPVAAADRDAVWPRVSPSDFCGDHERLQVPEGTIARPGAAILDPLTGRTTTVHTGI